MSQKSLILMKKYYYTIPLYEDEMNDNFYKVLDDMFNECFSKKLYIKP